MEGKTEAFAGWAIVELMGHRQRVGMAREVEMLGGKLLRIDIPIVPPKPEPPRLDWKSGMDGYNAQWEDHYFAVLWDDDEVVAKHLEAGKEVWRDTFVGTPTARAACDRRFSSLVPKPEPQPETPLAELPAATEFYGCSSIYSLRPCSEAVARALAERLGDPRPVEPLDYRERSVPQLPHYAEDDGRPF